MPGPDTAVEEAPALSALYLALVSLLMWQLFRALKAGWGITFGQMLEGLASILNFDYWKIHIHWGGPIKALDHAVLNALTKAALEYEEAMGFWFHAFARVQLWIVDETWKLTRDLYGFGGWLVHTYVPTYVHGWGDVLHGTTRTIIQTQKVIVRQAGTVAKVLTPAQVFELQWLGKHWKQLTKLVAASGAIALFPPTAIPKLWHGIDDLRKWRTHVNRRLHRLEGLLGATALAVAMANVLGVRARCLRGRGNIARAARALCGLPSYWLDLLLLSTFEAFAIADLCDLIQAEVRLAEWFQPLMMDLVDVDEWLIKNCSYDKAAPLSLPTLSLAAGASLRTLNGKRDRQLGLAA